MKPIALVLSIIMLLFGCAPVAPGADSSGFEPALSAPLTKEEEAMEEEAVEPAETPKAGSSTPEAADEETDHTQTADPVTVDLQQLTPAPEVAGTPVVQPAPGRPGDPTAKLLEAVTADLSRRLGVDVTEVELVEIVEVTWSDSSLGCPKPDMAYTQVLTDGHRVTLQAQGQTFVYHARDAAYFLLCESGNPSEPVTLPPDPEQ